MKKLTIPVPEIGDIEKGVVATTTNIGHGVGKLLTIGFPLARQKRLEARRKAIEKKYYAIQ